MLKIEKLGNSFFCFCNTKILNQTILYYISISDQ
ncbi:hypothetical protein HMPREF1089_05801 [Enterocloster bolteae 90B3]|uniref:Uncharacterized protein n=1 Tax=Enterocloster bolteae TaxID=208479 RepID=A0A6N2WA59_9FIRM|nr:hypothetical protein HMPREF1089_05801 [Enterocloster bolteae 90B3]